jgi:3-hydroxyisobutyrate dehydrogenase
MEHIMISPGKTRIGWIGTGVMGAAMCGHLLRAGFAATVHNRTREKAAPLISAGARWADSPLAVAEASDVIFTIVGFPADVREVILGGNGVLDGCRPGNIIVDMTTSEPRLAEEIALAANEKGVVAIDAPVSGGDIGARDGTLSIMLGGDAAAIEALRPCWEAMGKTFVRHGGPGAGQHAKLTNQILIAGNMIGVCEGLLYAHRAGLNPEKLLQSVAGGAAGSWSLNNLGPRIIAGDFTPGFMVEHFVKDLGIALDEAARMRLCLPGLALARQLYLSLVAHRRGRLGTQALQLALAEMSAIEWPGVSNNLN